jgi:hypothetical protein
VCTGLKSDDPQVWNFQLTAQDEAEWAQVRQGLLGSEHSLAVLLFLLGYAVQGLSAHK